MVVGGGGIFGDVVCIGTNSFPSLLDKGARKVCIINFSLEENHCIHI